MSCVCEGFLSLSFGFAKRDVFACLVFGVSLARLRDRHLDKHTGYVGEERGSI